MSGASPSPEPAAESPAWSGPRPISSWQAEHVRAMRSEDYWLDIGRHDDYETAMDEFERMRDRFLPGESR